MINKIKELYIKKSNKEFKKMNKKQMQKRINTLENENEVLKESIKSDLYKQFINKLGEPLKVERLTNENKQLRKKIKILRERNIEDQNGIRRSNMQIKKSSE